ncbi:MAG: KH domain-containing protein, partial [Ruminococcus bromii]
ENDMGRIIGKQGRIAKAIRTIARSAAIRSEEKIMVEID